MMYCVIADPGAVLMKVISSLYPRAVNSGSPAAISAGADDAGNIATIYHAKVYLRTNPLANLARVGSLPCIVKLITSKPLFKGKLRLGMTGGPHRKPT